MCSDNYREEKNTALKPDKPKMQIAIKYMSPKPAH